MSARRRRLARMPRLFVRAYREARKELPWRGRLGALAIAARWVWIVLCSRPYEEILNERPSQYSGL